MRLRVATLAHLDDAFPEFFELEASIVEGQSLQQKVKQKRNGKSKKKLKVEKPKDDFCACLSQNVVKCDVSGKKGKLPHSKYLLD